jgi:hypothetical protein
MLQSAAESSCSYLHYLLEEVYAVGSTQLSLNAQPPRAEFEVLCAITSAPALTNVCRRDIEPLYTVLWRIILFTNSIV